MWIFLKFGRRTRAIVEHDGRILVLKSWLGNDEWLLPGGGVRLGERPLDGLIREVKEETGLELDPKGLRYIGSGQTKNKGLKFSYEAFYVALQNPSPVKPRPLEIVEIAWKSPGDLDKTNSSQDLLELISK